MCSSSVDKPRILWSNPHLSLGVYLVNPSLQLCWLLVVASLLLCAGLSSWWLFWRDLPLLKRLLATTWYFLLSHSILLSVTISVTTYTSKINIASMGCAEKSPSQANPHSSLVLRFGLFKKSLSRWPAFRKEKADQEKLLGYISHQAWEFLVSERASAFLGYLQVPL